MMYRGIVQLTRIFDQIAIVYLSFYPYGLYLEITFHRCAKCNIHHVFACALFGVIAGYTWEIDVVVEPYICNNSYRNLPVVTLSTRLDITDFIEKNISCRLRFDMINGVYKFYDIDLSDGRNAIYLYDDLVRLDKLFNSRERNVPRPKYYGN